MKNVIDKTKSQYIRARLEQFNTGQGRTHFRRTVYHTETGESFIKHNGQPIPVIQSHGRWMVADDWQTPQAALPLGL